MSDKFELEIDGKKYAMNCTLYVGKFYEETFKKKYLETVVNLISLPFTDTVNFLWAHFKAGNADFNYSPEEFAKKVDFKSYAKMQKFLAAQLTEKSDGKAASSNAPLSVNSQQ